ncbi:MAG TPA: gamma-glutamylcyclotransferase [Geobacter sp.]|nr:gamma-glutamylcyclotransferase [Geobacter sp.]HCE67572.1 gamma-glutamylcyclotransferase [Geobacter sp.]
MLYFAYGSNLWRLQMAARCPEHLEIGTGRLDGWRWIITTRGYASIVKSEPDYVLGTVYELSEDDERNLDRFEGVARGLYLKEMLAVTVDGRGLSCLVYIDLVVEEGKPKTEYIDRINNGIRDACLPDEYVSRCLRPFVPGELKA